MGKFACKSENFVKTSNVRESWSPLNLILASGVRAKVPTIHSDVCLKYQRLVFLKKILSLRKILTILIKNNCVPCFIRTWSDFNPCDQNNQKGSIKLVDTAIPKLRAETARRAAIEEFWCSNEKSEHTGSIRRNGKWLYRGDDNGPVYETYDQCERFWTRYAPSPQLTNPRARFI